MSAGTEMTAEELRKKVLQLRHIIDQGEFSGDEEHSLLEQVFTSEQLEGLEESETLFAALLRVEKDYNRLTDVSDDLENSQIAVGALVALMGIEETVEEAEDEDDAEDDDGGDPDADLD